MSWQQHEDDCPGCRPAVCDPETMVQLPDEHPVMQAVLGVWKTTTLAERQAFHRMTCNNSREPSDMSTVQTLMERITAAIHQLN